MAVSEFFCTENNPVKMPTSITSFLPGEKYNTTGMTKTRLYTNLFAFKIFHHFLQYYIHYIKFTCEKICQPHSMYTVTIKMAKSMKTFSVCLFKTSIYLVFQNIELLYHFSVLKQYLVYLIYNRDFCLAFSFLHYVHCTFLN